MADPLDTREIVIATDGSAGAYVAVEQGVWLAKANTAKIDVQTVLQLLSNHL